MCRSQGAHDLRHYTGTHQSQRCRWDPSPKSMVRVECKLFRVPECSVDSPHLDHRVGPATGISGREWGDDKRQGVQTSLRTRHHPPPPAHKVPRRLYGCVIPAPRPLFSPPSVSPSRTLQTYPRPTPPWRPGHLGQHTRTERIGTGNRYTMRKIHFRVREGPKERNLVPQSHPYPPPTTRYLKREVEG